MKEFKEFSENQKKIIDKAIEKQKYDGISKDNNPIPLAQKDLTFDSEYVPETTNEVLKNSLEVFAIEKERALETLDATIEYLQRKEDKILKQIKEQFDIDDPEMEPSFALNPKVIEGREDFNYLCGQWKLIKNKIKEMEHLRLLRNNDQQN